MNELASSAKVGDVDYDAHLALVEDTFIGFEDHGIFCTNINFVFDSSAQGFGMLSLPPWFTNVFIMGMLNVFGVDQWESIKNKRIWILRGKESRMIEGVMSLTDPNKVFIIQDEWKKAKEVEDKNLGKA